MRRWQLTWSKMTSLLMAILRVTVLQTAEEMTESAAKYGGHVFVWLLQLFHFYPLSCCCSEATPAWFWRFPLTKRRPSHCPGAERWRRSGRLQKHRKRSVQWDQGNDKQLIQKLLPIVSVGHRSEGFCTLCSCQKQQIIIMLWVIQKDN